MIELRSESVDDTRAIAAAIAGLARAGDLIVLAGQMGAGKTAFAQGFAATLGITEPVTSPTYTLVHSYPALRAGNRDTGNRNDLGLHHADLYRLEHTAEVDDLALDELRDEAVLLVEWGDMVDLGPQLLVELETVEPDIDELDADGAGGADDSAGEHRDLTITSSDRRWDNRWDRLGDALRRWSR